MSEVLFFHHALGQTTGFLALMETLRQAGNVVHAPDLYNGKTFKDISEGVRHAQSIGFETLLHQAKEIANRLPAQLVYGGVSLGVMPAQMLTQTRPGAIGALLLEACAPVSEFGRGWPAGVPVQIHGMQHDPFFAGNGDIEAARSLVAAAPGAELFLYPGNQHLFMDNSLPFYSPQAAQRVEERMLRFLSLHAPPTLLLH